MRVFLSHSSKDAETASELCKQIEKAGHKCFFAPRDIRSGYEYAEEIITGIDNCDVMLLLLTESANNSPHVLREVERAVSKKKSIIVYKMEDVVLSKSLEYFLMTHQWLSAKSGKDHHEIVECINEFAKNHGDNNSPETSDNEPVVVSAKETNPAKRKLPIIIVLNALIVAVAGVIIGVNVSRNNSRGYIEESSVVSDNSNQNSEVSADSKSVSSSESVNAESTVNSVQSEPTVSTSENVSVQSDVNSVPTAAVTDSKPAAESKVELGDTITLGKYNGEPIDWRVIHISNDKQTAVVISNDILSMKAFDAAEGGKYNIGDGKDYWGIKTSELDTDLQRNLRGDNRWELSNIRTWLNSEKEIVEYKDQPPVVKAMSEYKNGYNTEAGFLKGFTKDELSMIVPTEVKTGNSTTTDKVFLLSEDELQWLYDADVSVYANPTAAAIEHDEVGWYKTNKSVYKTDDHFWWLRDADSASACAVRMVNMSYIDKKVGSANAGLEGYGVRPAMTINISAYLENTNEIN